VIKTSKYSMWVIPKCAPHIQDGGWPPSWKNEKWCNCLTDFDDQHIIWLFPHKEVPFVHHTAPDFVGQMSKNPMSGAWTGIFKSKKYKIFKFSYYQNYCSDSNKNLHNDIYIQVLFVCHPKCVPQMQDGGRQPIFKNDLHILIIFFNKTANIIKTKPKPVSFNCKSHCFKTAKKKQKFECKF